MIREAVNPSPVNSRGAWSLPSAQTYKTKPLLGSLLNQTPLNASTNAVIKLTSNDLVANSVRVGNSPTISPKSSPKVISHKWLQRHLTLLPSNEDGRLKVFNKRIHSFSVLFHFTSLHFTSLHFTSIHFTSLHFTTRHIS